MEAMIWAAAESHWGLSTLAVDSDSSKPALRALEMRVRDSRKSSANSVSTKSAWVRGREVWNTGFRATRVSSNSGLNTAASKRKVVSLDMMGWP